MIMQWSYSVELKRSNNTAASGEKGEEGEEEKEEEEESYRKAGW